MGAGIVEWNTPYEYYPMHGVTAAYVGLYECHMGASSVNQCGTIEATNMAEWVLYEVKGWLHVEHLDQLCAPSISGDSGGPVQYGNSSWTYVTAIDVAGNGNTSSCSGGAKMWGYEIPYAETFIGVHLQTEP
jgi:hypothetical protein